VICGMIPQRQRLSLSAKVQGKGNSMSSTNAAFSAAIGTVSSGITDMVNGIGGIVGTAVIAGLVIFGIIWAVRKAKAAAKAGA